ncbi:MAG: SdrD B-like domain-containing protein [Christensenella sp.]|nr:SdrD B-like domain-containing protein [Christensenella sp.]
MKKRKNRALPFICVALAIGALALLLPVRSAQAGTQVYYVPNETKPTPVNFLNGSFQSPTVTYVRPYDGARYNSYTIAQMASWSTCPVDYAAYGTNPNAYLIELQVVDPTGMAGVPFTFATTQADEDQYAELNCLFPGRLYQVVSTTPGSRLYWQFAHRAIGNSSTKYDQMNFYLRPSGTPTTAPSGSQLIQTANNNGTQWYYYRGAYTVPAGQTSTEFDFAAVSSWTGNVQNGNFLDDVAFQTGAKLIAKKSITTLQSGNTTAWRNQVVTISVKITNWGETDASRCVFRDILSDGLDFVSGSVTIDGYQAGSRATFNSTTDELRVNFGDGATAGTSATNGGVTWGSRNTIGINLQAGEGMTHTISYQARVTGPVGMVVKNQASVTYNDRNYEGYNASGFTSYSSVTGRTVNSADETSYVNRFTVVGGSISGRVWVDLDSDGTIDASETRLSGITVTAYDHDDTFFANPLRSATTNASGVYTLTPMDARVYQLQMTLPGGYVVTRLVNDNDASANALSPQTYARTGNVSVSTTTPTVTNIDFGLTSNRTIAGRAWYDTNTDGTIDAAESRVSGLTVGIYANTDTTYSTPLTNLYGQSLTTTTNATGTYSFSLVPYGTYKVVITTPSGHIVTRLANDNDASPSGTRAVISNVALTTATSVSNMDFGFTPNRTISGRVWYDTDTDGTIDAAETMVSGLIVRVFANTDTTYSTPLSSIYGFTLVTTTSATGTYSISAIPNGTYKVVVTTPSGYVVTTLANDNNAVPSGTHAVVSDVALTTATSASNIDFGFAVDRTIAGRAWMDTDVDGTIDVGETLLSGLTVGVYANTDTTYTSPLTNLYGAALTTTTSASGTYGFSLVPYGTYKIVVTTPAGYVVTVHANDNDATPFGTRAIIGNVAVTTATSVNNMDFGFADNRTIAGRAWVDTDADGAIDASEAAFSGLTVGVYANTDTTYTTPITNIYGAALTTTTSATGTYSFAAVPIGTYKVVITTPSGYIVTTLANDNDAIAFGTRAVAGGIDLVNATTVSNVDFGFVPNRTLAGRIWYDADTDGTIDASETLAAGLMVSLYSNTDTAYTTPVNDLYGNPLTATTDSSGVYGFSYIPYGAYKAVVTTPAGHIVTVLANDNDAVPSGVRAVISGIDLTSATSSTNRDFGFAPNRIISGIAWTDLDWDGMLDSGETRMSGLTVGVYPAASTTYTTPVNDLRGTPLTATTDANGEYSFSQIPYGSYKVVTITPDNHIVTLKTGTTDNDAVAQSANAVIIGVDLTTATSANRQDFGFTIIRSITGRVWMDTSWDGMIDTAEKRLSGFMVGLYAAGDTAYTTPVSGIYGSPLIAATNTAGEYTLNGIPQGTYQIVMTTPTDLKVTLKTVSTDNDAEAFGTRAIIGDVTFAGATAAFENMDFGYGLIPTADKNARLNGSEINNGTPTAPVETAINDTITYTINVQWNDVYGLMDIGAVDISDTLPAGLKLVTDAGTYTPGMTWTTDASTNTTTVTWNDVVISSAQHQFQCQVTVKNVNVGAPETIYENSATVTAGTTTIPTNSTYHKVGTRTITLSKIVKGNLADPKEEFNFRITLNDVGGTLSYTGASTIAGVSAPPNGTISSGFDIISLKHGQSITIDHVPVGSSYVISEILIFSGYQLAITETSGGSFTPVGNAGAGGMISGDVHLQFENTLIGTVPTGILLHIFPYALMTVLAGGILTLSLSLARRKRQSRRGNSKRI